MKSVCKFHFRNCNTNSFFYSAAANTSGSSSAGQANQQQSSHAIQEPNVDLELDVMIYFNSGKCVLHTRDTTSEEAGKKGMVKERSFIGNLLDVGNTASVQPSPKSNQPRYHVRSSSGSLPKTLSTGGLKANVSSSRLRYPGIAVAQHPAECTVFLIPGLDIKVHYNSKNVSTDTPQVNNSAAASFGPSPNPSRQGINKDLELHSTNTTSGKKSGMKKAACFAWMTLHSIPEETVITPHILDFLEQALEPIPIDTPATVVSPSNENPDDILTSAPAQYAVYGSFPVDVIVYLHVQPSVLRFSCLPVSRVECLLQLPSVDLVFSSKRAEDELVDVPAQPKAKLTAPGKAVFAGRANHRRAGSDFRGFPQPESSVGGLSMSGCLADFSLYIFHPYGGQKKSTVDLPSSLNKSAMTSVDKMLSSRKDSLSLQVEFVKVNISRSRKITLETSAPRVAPEKQSVNIKFSALCDIGSASFKYDMRRLTEILAFPRAWYRKAIWKRMFLGDESIRSTLFSDDSDEEDEDEEEEEEQSSGTPSSSASEDEGIEVAGTSKKSKSNLDKRKTSFENKNKNSMWLNFNEGQKRSPTKHGDWKQYTAAPTKQQQNAQVINAPWETLVLFAVNLSKLNIQMNMGNVMGNSTWLTRGFRSQGRVSIDSSGHKRYTVGLGLDGSALDAKGGIVGGVIEISSVETKMIVKEDRGKEPDHVVKLKLKTLQKRLDYMGTSVLMMRISDLDLTLRDEWRIDQFHGNKNVDPHPTKRPALVFIHGNLIWDQLQIMMSKSTTPDIVKIIAKLEEFFTQQFTSSKRVLSSLEPNQRAFHRSSSLKGQRVTKKHSTGAVGQEQQPQPTVPFLEARHHRHWQRALKLVSGVHLNSLPNPLPVHGTILGGTVELTGRHISVACFYGINFRSKAWGIFSLRQPTISFATESQELLLNGTDLTDTHVIQNLSVSLGRIRHEHLDTALYAQHTTMATVCRMSRTVMFPPQFRQMHEWFQYTFATSDLDEVSRFPVIEFERGGEATTPSGDTVFGGGEIKRRISMSPKSQQFHHNKEVIFAFPSFQMELKTEHLQAPNTPTSEQPKPVIDCTFVTDFDDHIFVAVDAEAYFFLHELITSYIRERDPNYGKAQLSPGTETKSTPSQPGTSRKLQTESSAEITTDWREFVCHTWHLEPTVRYVFDP